MMMKTKIMLKVKITIDDINKNGVINDRNEESPDSVIAFVSVFSFLTAYLDREKYTTGRDCIMQPHWLPHQFTWLRMNLAASLLIIQVCQIICVITQMLPPGVQVTGINS